MERIQSQSFSFHRLQLRLDTTERPRKRAKAGRPPKDEERVYETVWRVDVRFDQDGAMLEQVMREETCFVLVTNVPVGTGGRQAADAETLEAYGGQDNVERCFRWAKDPLSVAPIFLKTEKRIAAMGLVYVVALMVYALIQREARQRLLNAKTEMPGNKGWTQSPTTEVVFRLFNNVNTLQPADPSEPVLVLGLDTEQVRVLRLLGVDALWRPGIALGHVKEPVPGNRSFRPRPRQQQPR
jgi:transposase